jgi:hypothetical protein
MISCSAVLGYHYGGTRFARQIGEYQSSYLLRTSLAELSQSTFSTPKFVSLDFANDVHRRGGSNEF